MRSIESAVKGEHRELNKAISRAGLLYRQISDGQLMINGTFRGPRAPDSRNIAELLFFGVASHWEAFCTTVFELELKQRYGIHRKVALSIMSSVPIDENPEFERFQISGYGNPRILINRAKFLLSVRSPWVTFVDHLGNQSFEYLVRGYRIRNYIAHAGVGKGREDFIKVLNEMSVPTAQRRGMSAGRLLIDYPRGNPSSNRLFNLLLTNYKDVSDYVLSRSS